MSKYSQRQIKAMAKHLVNVEGGYDGRYQQFVTSLSRRTGTTQTNIRIAIMELAS